MFEHFGGHIIWSSQESACHVSCRHEDTRDSKVANLDLIIFDENIPSTYVYIHYKLEVLFECFFNVPNLRVDRYINSNEDKSIYEWSEIRGMYERLK